MLKSSNAKAFQNFLPQSELATLHSTLAGAEDAKIPRLLALVDKLEHRGASDDLIAPFRARIAQLGPPRPLRFTRLLFMPLDPLIVPLATWQAKSPLIPRSALLPMSRMIRAAMAEDATRIDRMIEGRRSHDYGIIAEAGPLLWSGAAQALTRSAGPGDWTDHDGLPGALIASIAGNTGAVFGEVLTMQTWRAEAEMGVSMRTSALRQMLQRVRRRSPEALAMLIALLLARLPQAIGALRRAIAEIGGNTGLEMRAATEAAVDNLLERLEASDGIETAVLGTMLHRAGAEVWRIYRLMACADVENAKPSLRVRLGSLRRRLDESCRLRFIMGLQADFLQVMENPAAQVDIATVRRLEAAARGLRELADEAGRVGKPGAYELLLRQTTDATRAITVDGAFTLADKVRLVEILAGPDEAWSLLDDTPD